MDKIKDLASKATGKAGGSSSGGAAGGQEDYVDKGLDSVENKAGLDSKNLRSTNEKITDAGRGEFEKSTGKDIPDKISN